MKNSILLYFPYKLNRTISGSSVRPNKIISEFNKFTNENNKNLIIISGDSNERKLQVNTLKKNYLLSSLEYCYFENSTLPFWLTDTDKIPRNINWETKFLKELNNSNVPIGIFYRDVYWKFKDYYPFKGIKLSVMKAIYNKELRFYDKIASKIFLPSVSMNDFCKFKTPIIPLPPGVSNTKPSNNKFDKKTLFYVGTLNENNGLNDLIDIIKKIDSHNLNLKLKVVCPKKDFLLFKDKFETIMNYNNVEVKHVFGEDLKKEYEEASIAIIPRKVNDYNSFAMPIKLFEYIENGLPIISSNVTETARFIKNNNIGYIYHNPDEIVDILHKVLEFDKYNELLKNINQIKEENSWRSRILLINETLCRNGDESI